MSRLGAALLAAVMLASAAPVVAREHRAPPGENPVEKIAEQATNAYRAGDFAKAAELLEKAYQMQPITAILYNLAKAHDKLNNTDRAVELYKRYVVAEDSDPRLRQKAVERLQALGKPVEVKPPEPAKVTEPAKPAEPEPPKAPPPPDPYASERRARKRDLGIGIGLEALAGACGIVAIALGATALQLQDQYDHSLDEAQKRQWRDDAKGRAIGVDVLLPVAAVAAGIGGWMLWRGTRKLPAAPKQALYLLPAPLLNGGALVAGGRF